MIFNYFLKVGVKTVHKGAKSKKSYSIKIIFLLLFIKLKKKNLYSLKFHSTRSEIRN